MTCPLSSAATQNFDVGQEICVIPPWKSILTICHASAPPVGLLDQRTSPSKSPAMQKDADVQVAVRMLRCESMVVICGGDLVKSLHVTTLPPFAIPTQSLSSGQATETIAALTPYTVHLSAPPAGLLDCAMNPEPRRLLPTTVQLWSLRQAIPVTSRSWEPGKTTFFQDGSPPPGFVEVKSSPWVPPARHRP